MKKRLNIKEEYNRVFEPKGTKFVETCSRWFLIFCIFLAGIVSYFHIVYEIAPVAGESMQPTLNKNEALNDTVVINVFLKYDIGDIVVVDRSTSKDNKNFHIKRIVAMEGDKINIVQAEVDGKNDYYLKRNGKIIKEDYVKIENEKTGKTGMNTTYNNFLALRTKSEFKDYFDKDGNLTIPKDYVFVLGDNRGHSTDSSFCGPYLKKSIVGKVQYVVPSGTTVVEFFLIHFFELPSETKKLYSNV